MPYAVDSRDRWKAILMVIALHVALGAGLILGLAGDTVRRAADALTAFDVLQPPEVMEEPPPPPPATSEAAAQDAGAPDLRAQPAEVVAPEPVRRLPIPSPVRTSDEQAPAPGSDASAGAALVPGPGRGAGGDGTGFGGGGSGGSGSGSGGGLGSEARLLSGNLSRRDYRNLRDFGIPTGRAILALSVAPNGRLAGCTVIVGSGSPDLDEELCALMMARSRWAPALDRMGRPVQVELRYTAVWNRN